MNLTIINFLFFHYLYANYLTQKQLLSYKIIKERFIKEEISNGNRNNYFALNLLRYDYKFSEKYFSTRWHDIGHDINY